MLMRMRVYMGAGKCVCVRVLACLCAQHSREGVTRQPSCECMLEQPSCECMLRPPFRECIFQPSNALMHSFLGFGHGMCKQGLGLQEFPLSVPRWQAL